MVKSRRVLLKSGVIVSHGRMAGIARFSKEAEVGQLYSSCQGAAFWVSRLLLRSSMCGQQQNQEKVQRRENGKLA